MIKRTYEMRKNVADDYAAGMPTAEIIKKHGVNTHQLIACVDEFGVPHRRTRNKTRSDAGFKKCPHCKRTIALKDAKFCPYCTTDIRDERDLLQERISKAFSALALVPVNARDELQQLLKDMSAYIDKH